jgi:hypothetical protein
MAPRYTDAEVYAVYERLGSAVLVASELDMNYHYICKMIRRHRRDALGVSAKIPKLSTAPRSSSALAVVPPGDDDLVRLEAKIDEVIRLLKVTMRALAANLRETG